jgi:hypothetical protein
MLSELFFAQWTFLFKRHVQKASFSARIADEMTLFTCFAPTNFFLFTTRITYSFTHYNH